MGLLSCSRFGALPLASKALVQWPRDPDSPIDERTHGKTGPTNDFYVHSEQNFKSVCWMLIRFVSMPKSIESRISFIAPRNLALPIHSCWQTRSGFRAIFACSREMTLGRRRDKEPSSDGCSEFVRTPGLARAPPAMVTQASVMHFTRARASQASKAAEGAYVRLGSFISFSN